MTPSSSSSAAAAAPGAAAAPAAPGAPAGPEAHEPRPNPLRRDTAAPAAPGAAGAAAAPGAAAVSSSSSSAAPPAPPAGPDADAINKLLLVPVQAATYRLIDFYAERQRKESPTRAEIDQAHIPELAAGTIQAWFPSLNLDPRWVVTLALAGSIYVLVDQQPARGDRSEAPVRVRPLTGATAPAAPAAARAPARQPEPEPAEPAAPDDDDDEPLIDPQPLGGAGGADDIEID